MRTYISRKRRFFFSGPTRCIFAVVGLFFVLLTASAQRPGEEEARRGMERIDQEEGAKRLQLFRSQRLEGDYVFDFQLAHKPRRSSRTIRYDGVMWGSWNENGAVTRFKILPRMDDRKELSETVELIVQNGAVPNAWMRRGADETFKRVEGAALFAPILPDLVYSVFDLQMPFIYWKDFVYEGPSLVGASRVGQNFLMLPPDNAEGPLQDIKGVRVTLDDTYNALWRIEVIDSEVEVRSRFSVESFQKVQEQYIVKRITLTEYPGKDRTTFQVLDASVGLKLDDQLFELPLEALPAPTASSCSASQ